MPSLVKEHAMEITEVRIKLTQDSDDRLQAFCSITFDDCFVVRDLKVIEGTNGPFVAMPSRKLTSHCPRCGCKNHLRASHCNQCGGKLNPDRAPRDAEGRAKLYADIAHPINSKCRETIQERVITAYQQELELSKNPGYVSRYDDDYDDDFSVKDLRDEIAGQAPAENPQEFARTDAEHETRDVPPPHAVKPTEPIPPATSPQKSERQVPPPHKPPSTPPAAKPPHKPGFGAGILDE
jgi:stage V sporulation protein G